MNISQTLDPEESLQSPNHTACSVQGRFVAESEGGSRNAENPARQKGQDGDRADGGF